jgi:hypothetical protein
LDGLRLGDLLLHRERSEPHLLPLKCGLTASGEKLPENFLLNRIRCGAKRAGNRSSGGTRYATLRSCAGWGESNNIGQLGDSQTREAL